MTTSASPQPGQYKRSVKNYLIDSRFQLKYTSMIVFVTLVISGVMGGFLWKTSRAVIAESQGLVNESKKVSEVSKMNIKNLGYDDPQFLGEFSKESEEYDKKLDEQAQALARQQNTMLYALVGGLAGMVLLIGLLGIYFTHKVAGPIYKMKRLLLQVGEGKLKFEGRLRKGDELKDFFESFATMVEKLRARQQMEIDELDRAIELAKGAGASTESIAKVMSVRDGMRQALDAP